MDVEIITIGDEVVTGHTVDTNSSFIGRALTDIGLDRAIVDLEVGRSLWQRPLSGWQHQARGRRTDPLD